MHEAVRNYVRSNLPREYQSVLEVGSYNINGGVRDLLNPEASYVGIDLQPGVGVDVVQDFASYESPHKVDLVLCLEVLEHAENWREIIASAARNLKPDGTLIMTCATTGRQPHSAKSEEPISGDEFYENVTAKDLAEELSKHFGLRQTQVVGTDLHARALSPIWHGYSVIIPSCNDLNAVGCAYSLFGMDPEIQAPDVTVVSDGLSMGVRDKLNGVWWIEGKEPFVFAEAINAGVKAAHPSADIVILGDDVRFETPNAIEELARLSDGASIVVPEVVGVCGQPAQRQGSIEETADWVAFICAYIPRKVWDAVGGLDERFTGYGYDDVDWCKRAAPHGEIRIAHGVTVRHLDGESSYRTTPGWESLYMVNRKKFAEKWPESGVRV